MAGIEKVHYDLTEHGSKGLNLSLQLPMQVYERSIAQWPIIGQTIRDLESIEAARGFQLGSEAGYGITLQPSLIGARTDPQERAQTYSNVNFLLERLLSRGVMPGEHNDALTFYDLGEAHGENFAMFAEVVPKQGEDIGIASDALTAMKVFGVALGLTEETTEAFSTWFSRKRGALVLGQSLHSAVSTDLGDDALMPLDPDGLLVNGNNVNSQEQPIIYLAGLVAVTV